MSNPAPVLNMTGRVHSVLERTVPPVLARDAVRDEHGNVTQRAVEARDGYDVHDVTLLTEDGGFATAVLMPEALVHLEGELPTPGTETNLAVRPYVAWQRTGSRSFPRVGFSIAGDVMIARSKTTSAPRSVSAAS